ncbi:MAG: PVC-type heme-binding CxxCH protein [Candidatus Hydrogenedentes bacterium]|nr:PVC-type heme-binding CxxCH protein [Candidatus Hydrogenedentota bacterium]
MMIRNGFMVFLVVLSTPAFAQRDLQNIPAPDAAEEQASFHVADGFEVNLFASEPMLAKPIAINFDAQGRLWIVGSAIYPHIAPGAQPADRVYVIEDSDGDGAADKSTVFAEGLFIPTGVLPGDGGVYVSNSTELLHLSDTDGDGKADKTRIMLSGFGTEDTHHIIHTLRWGMDGMLYFNQSIYIHSHIETPYGVRTLNGGGIWQFRPESMQLEVYARGFVNAWGHQFDSWGQSFATDGAYLEGINYVFPGACFLESKSPKILHGLNPGSPKHCSMEILSGSHLPEEWRGNFITNDFRAHRVCRFVLRENGSGYTSTEQPELITSSHVAFRPVDVKMGPDGAIYIADWYNPIIQHGEVDFRDERRDREHGRIWRVTAKGRPLVKKPEIAGQSIGALLELLKSEEEWVRMFARLELKTHDKEAVRAETRAWAAALDPGIPSFEHNRLEALWAFQTIDAPEPALLGACFASPDHHARAAAVRVYTHWNDRLPEKNALETLIPFTRDAHAQVRLEAVRALGLLASPEAADAAITVLDASMDDFLDHALWLTLRELAPAWLPEIDKDNLAFSLDPERLLFALQAVDNAATVAPLLTRLQSGAFNAEQEARASQLVATHGAPEDLGVLLARAAHDGKDSVQQHLLLQILIDTSSRRGIVPAGDTRAVVALLNSSNADIRVLAVRALGAWKIADGREQITALAAADDAPEPLRAAAIETLGVLGGDASAQILSRLAAPPQTALLRAQATLGLARINRDNAITAAIALLSDTAEEPVIDVLLRGMLQADGGPAALTAALANAKIGQDTAKIAERIISSSGRNEEALLKAMRVAAGIGEAHEPTAEEIMQLAAESQAHGNPAAGEAQYRKLECAKCHAIGGAGGVLGPDLSSIGGSAQPDYLVASMLTPNSAIKEGFHSIIVETNDLESHSGIKVREDDNDIVLRDANSVELVIAKDTIESVRDGQSLMPSGLADTLLRDEFTNLVRFMSELGRSPDYSIGTTRRGRTWRVLAATQPAAQALQNAAFEVASENPPDFTWASAYSITSGSLPLGDVPKLSHTLWEGQKGIARCQLEAANAGAITLRIADAKGLRLWVGGNEATVGETVVAQVPGGTIDLNFLIDFSQAVNPLQVELVDAPGSANAQFVGGR